MESRNSTTADLYSFECNDESNENLQMASTHYQGLSMTYGNMNMFN